MLIEKKTVLAGKKNINQLIRNLLIYGKNKEKNYYKKLFNWLFFFAARVISKKSHLITFSWTEFFLLLFCNILKRYFYSY